MITATARQLNGKLTINDLAPGTEFCLELPASIQEAEKEADIPSVTPSITPKA
jgi:hypothetical protein